jgi:3-dehydroquinate synthase
MPTELNLVTPGPSRASRVLLDAPLADLARLAKGRRAVIVSDPNVHRLQGHLFPDWPVIEIGLGEAAKTLATFERVARALVERDVDRSTLVVGIGGGIVCDVTGFVASTLLRGTPSGFAPTTLVAQVDAAIGGKNGVNLDGFKNLIGTFHQPEFVLSDHAVLATLPARELRCGIAEAIKTAAIGESDLFAFLETRLDEVLGCHRAAIARVVEAAARTKIRVVAGDEYDCGQRRLLNFGHTLGHAMEALSDYIGLLHGEAISMGMCCGARLSVKRTGFGDPEAKRLTGLIAASGLPTKLATKFKLNELLAAARFDKKARNGKLRFVLLKQLGEAVVTDAVTDADLEEAVNVCR